MQVYEPLHGRFERYCKTRCNGNALFRDVMHDTLLIAFEKFESIQSREAFLHFLFGTASRVLANQRRNKKPEPEKEPKAIIVFAVAFARTS